MLTALTRISALAVLGLALSAHADTTTLSLPIPTVGVETSGAVQGTFPSLTPGALRLKVRLVSGSTPIPEKTGEALFPLPLLADEAAALRVDWNNRVSVSLELRCDPVFLSHPIAHRGRLFLQDTAGRRLYFPNLMFAPWNSGEGGWFTLRGETTTDLPIPLGYTEQGFDAARITHFGFNIEAGDRAGYADEGEVELRNLTFTALAQPQIPNVLPVDPAIIAGETERAHRMNARLVERRRERAGKPMLGVNLAWPGLTGPDGNYLHLYSNWLESPELWFGEHYDLRSPRVERALREDFASIRGTFGPWAPVRVFLFTTLVNGIEFAEDGTPLRVSAEARANFAKMLTIAAEEQLLIIPVFFDFLMADGHSSTPPADRPWATGERVDLILDAAKRQALWSAMEEFIRPFANHPNILVWDVINEPENAVAVVTPRHFAEYQRFMQEGVEAIHRAGELATVGHRNLHEVPRFMRGRLATDFGQAHYYPRLESRPNPTPLGTSPEAAFGPLPSGWGELPAEGGSIAANLGEALSGGHRYMMFWSWREEGGVGDGFSVRSHADEIRATLASYDRAEIEAPATTPYIFTMDDVPMWYVGDAAERIDAYRRYEEVLTRHGITEPVIFMNPGFQGDPEEWRTFNEWNDLGWHIANHNANHRPISEVPLAAWHTDVARGALLLDQRIPGWRGNGGFYRHPNSHWSTVPGGRGGSDPEDSCHYVNDGLGLTILPVTTSVRDWAHGTAYHQVAGSTIEGRNTPQAREVAQRFFDDLELEYTRMRARRALGVTSADQPEIFLIHSHRFSRDYLDEVLTRLEAKGVRWVPPTAENLRHYEGYRGMCRPRCKVEGTCR
mgnify:CR=1 FL=1